MRLKVDVGLESRLVLEHLRHSVERSTAQDWAISNGCPVDIRPRTFRSYLSKLSQHGTV
jgi:hypothetical protein